MNKNYPKIYDNLWDKLSYKGRATKSKNGFKYVISVTNNDNDIDIFLEDELVVRCRNDKESLYCELLDLYLAPRVKEYI